MRAPPPLQPVPTPPSHSVAIQPEIAQQQHPYYLERPRHSTDSGDPDLEDHSEDEIVHESPETVGDEDGHEKTRYGNFPITLSEGNGISRLHTIGKKKKEEASVYIRTNAHILRPCSLSRGPDIVV